MTRPGLVLVVSEKGYGKKTQIDEYRITNRGGKGVKTISVTDKTGSLVGVLDVTEKEDLMITCKSGVTIRTPVNQISAQGRATQGVKLIRLDGGDEIAAITKLDEHVANELPGMIESAPMINIEGEATDNPPETSTDSMENPENNI